MANEFKKLESHSGHIVLYNTSAVLDQERLTKMIIVSPNVGMKLGGAQVAEVVTHACYVGALKAMRDLNKPSTKLGDAIRIYSGYAKPLSANGLKNIVEETLDEQSNHSDEVDFLVETAEAATNRRLANSIVELKSSTSSRVDACQFLEIKPQDTNIDVVVLDLSDVPRVRS